MIRRFKIAEFERGLLFKEKNFVGVLAPGRYIHWDPLFRIRVEVYDVTDNFLEHSYLDTIVKSGRLGADVEVLDLTDHERALVWVDGRLEAVLKPGRYVLWTIFKTVRVEVIDARKVRIDHRDLSRILALRGTSTLVDLVDVDAEEQGLFFLDGVFQERLAAGRYAFWKGEGRVDVRRVTMREQVIDIGGQEIMTSDKVTLRLNAVVGFRVRDAHTAVTAVEDYRQALYRAAQLALRAVVGTRTLDALLREKDAVTAEVEKTLAPRVESLGLALREIGIRDVILPGDMRELLNKVTEANLITRREETAAVRSQLNAARILESNPTLMRLRELEVLERVTSNAKLSVVLGEKGLADKVMKLL